MIIFINNKNKYDPYVEESNLSNKAKRPSENSFSDSDDEFDDSEENLSKTKKNKSRTKSDVVDLRRASFSDYYKFVKEDLNHMNSVDAIDMENNKIISEVKSFMEMSKADTPGNKNHANKLENKDVLLIFINFLQFLNFF